MVSYGDAVQLSSSDSAFKFTFVLAGGKGVIKNGTLVLLSKTKDQETNYLSPHPEFALGLGKQKFFWVINIQSGQETLQNGATVTFSHVLLSTVNSLVSQPSALSASSDRLLLSSRATKFTICKTLIDPIEHVVVVMLENRSYFRMFAYLTEDPEKKKYFNTDEQGNKFETKPVPLVQEKEPRDPPHEIDPVHVALNSGTMDGFVKSYGCAYPEEALNEIEKEDIMGYYAHDPEHIMLHRMAEFSSVCTQWHSSLPGPTWPNRMFSVSGTSFGWRTTPVGAVDDAKSLSDWLISDDRIPPPQKKSIFSVLKDKNSNGSFRLYTDSEWPDVPLTFALYPEELGVDHFSRMDEFKKKVKEGSLENYVMIEPQFVGDEENDDHPPSSPYKAQVFINKIYSILRSNSDLFSKTLLIVTYDEHGGYFDPQFPPAAPVPDVFSEKEAAFGMLGIRVPSVIVSPWVPKGLDSTIYDHTSILKYVILKWAPNSVGHLGQRVFHANPLQISSTKRDLNEFPLDMKPKPDPLAESRVRPKEAPLHVDDPTFRSMVAAEVEKIVTYSSNFIGGVEKVISKVLGLDTPYRDKISAPKNLSAEEHHQLLKTRYEAELRARTKDLRRVEGEHASGLHTEIFELMDQQAGILAHHYAIRALNNL